MHLPGHCLEVKSKKRGLDMIRYSCHINHTSIKRNAVVLCYRDLDWGNQRQLDGFKVYLGYRTHSSSRWIRSEGLLSTYLCQCWAWGSSGGHSSWSHFLGAHGLKRETDNEEFDTKPNLTQSRITDLSQIAS